MSTPRQRSDPDGGKILGWGCAAFLIIAFGVSALSSTKDELSNSSSSDNMMNVEAAEAVPAAPEEPLPLDASAVRRGNGQMKLVANLNLAGAPKIYSQNCYEALEKTFDWHQLDRCGGFDTLETRNIENGGTATGEETDWFQSETAATRFLGAATGHGLPAEQADLRWAAIQAAASKAKLPRTAAVEIASAPGELNTLEDAIDSLPPAAPAAEDIEETGE